MIVTERLRLRPWSDDDIDAFAKHNANPQIMRHFPSVMTRAQTAGTVRRWQREFERYGFTFFAAELRQTREFIGVIGPAWHAHASPFAPAVEIGWRLHPDYWGEGYATEGALASIAFMFDRGTTEIVAVTVPDNVASRAVMERVGMMQDLDGNFAHPMGGDIHVLYRIDRATFNAKFPDHDLYALEP